MTYLTSIDGTYFRRPVAARVGGTARFHTSDAAGDPIVHLLQQPLLRCMKTQLVDRMVSFGWGGRADSFDYTPHVTVQRAPRDEPWLVPHARHPDYVFRYVAICCGDAMLSLSLGVNP